MDLNNATQKKMDVPVLAAAEGEITPRGRDRPKAGKTAQNKGPKHVITCGNNCERAVFFCENFTRKRDVG